MTFAAVSLAQFAPSPQPSYGGPNANIRVDNMGDRMNIETQIFGRLDSMNTIISDEEYYEWEGYDGWYNNPAHPEWGGAGEFTDRARGGNADTNRYIVPMISFLIA